MSVQIKTDNGWIKVAGNSRGGGSGASSWAELSGKPFESIGQNLSVDSQGRLNASGGSSGTTDYSALSNKPKINNVELSGNKSLADLGIQSEINSGNLLPSNLVLGDRGMTVYEQYVYLDSRCSDLNDALTTLQEAVGTVNNLLEGAL